MVVTMAMQSVLIPTEIYVTRGCGSKKDRQCNREKTKKTKGQTAIYKALHTKLKSSKPNTTKNRG